MSGAARDQRGEIVVLHVDDEAGFLDLTAEFLAREDDSLVVVSETSPEDGLERLADTAVDCVVSDYQMPGMDGLDFLDAVRAEYADLPFIIFTGKGREEVAMQALNKDADRYLQKGGGATAQFGVLAQAIRQEVEHYRTAKQATQHEQRYRRLFTSMNEGVAIHRLVVDDAGVPVDYELLDVNPAYERILDIDAGDAVGALASELYRPDDPPYLDEYARVVETGAPTEFETYYEPLDRYFRVSVYQPSPGRFGTVFTDITERKEHQRLLETLISNLPGVVYRCRNERGWPMDLVRGECEELTGYPADAVESGEVSWGADVIHPDDRERVVETVQDAVDRGESFELTYRIRTADGEERWVWERGRQVYVRRHGEQRLEGFITDITERKRQEAALEAETRYREQLLDALKDIIYVHDADGRLIEWNRQAQSVTGYDTDELDGMHIADVLAEFGRDEVLDALDGLDEDGQFRVETTLQTKDGDEVPYEFIATTVDHPEHDRVYAGVGRNVADRLEREQQITTLHEVADEMHECSTADDVFRVLADAAETVLEYDLAIVDAAEGDVLVPRAVSTATGDEAYFDETPIDAEDNLGALAYRTGEPVVVDDLLEEGVSPADARYRSALTVPLGEYGVFQTVSSEVGAFDADDLELVEILASHARTTLDRLSREESLQAQAAELKRQNERLEEFATLASHDLRNPLNVAMGRLELARETGADEHFEAADRALQRMYRLIDDVLALARNGRQVADTTHVELAELVSECWELVDPGDAELHVGETVRFQADASRVKTVLENLFRNAIEHGGDGVSIRVGALDGRGFYVEDDGPGVPPGERDRVFEAGYSTSDAGYGLGLAIVKRVVEAHDWDVVVTEGDAGGARFEITW